MTKRKSKPKICIGTSGWNYNHWRGRFYPEDLTQSKYLEYISTQFNTVEINASFYRLPTEKTFASWRDTTGQDFTFAVKGSRYITHLKKLKDPDQGVTNFMDNVVELGDKLGPILFQLPPHWKSNSERLRSFLDFLPADHRFAFELRDPSWINEENLDILHEHNAAFCIYDFNYRQSPIEVTADFVYIRLHGPDGAYQGQYSEEDLQSWADRIKEWSEKGLDVFCYFDNDQLAYAPQDASRLKQMVQELAYVG